MSDTSALFVGEPVTGVGIPVGATIASIDTASSITLSAAATTTGASALTFYESHLFVGEPVSGVGIQAGTTVTAIAGNSITLSLPYTGVTGAAVLNFQQTYYYQITAITPLGESVLSTGGQQVVTTDATVDLSASLAVATPNTVTISAAAAAANVVSAGMVVTGPGIPAGTTVFSVVGTTVTITGPGNTTITGSVNLEFSLATPNNAAALTWSPVSGATGYKIYRSLNSNNFAEAYLASVVGTSYTDGGPVSLQRPVLSAVLDPTPGGVLTPNTTYYYTVTASGLAGETLPGVQVAVTTNATQLTVDVSWAPVPVPSATASTARRYRATSATHSWPPISRTPRSPTSARPRSARPRRAIRSPRRRCSTTRCRPVAPWPRRPPTTTPSARPVPTVKAPSMRTRASRPVRPPWAC